MNGTNIRKQNLCSFLLLTAGIVLALLLMQLPLYSFRAGVYTKKSSNTFVGDEKYQEVRAEVDALALQYEEQGFEVSVNENVTERKNSKGETTSLVAFSIDQVIPKRIFDFALPAQGGTAGSVLPSSHVLRLMLGFMLLALVCAVGGLAGSGNTAYKDLDKRSRMLRGASGLFLLIDFLLVPVFILLNNYLFWRKIGLYQEEQITEGKEAFFACMDQFLFAGKMGDGIEAALKNLDVTHSPLVWALLLCFLLAAGGAVRLRFGMVKRSALRFALYLFVAAVCVVTLYPYYVMLVTAFRSNAETLDMYFLHMLPTKWVWSNLKDIVDRGVLQFLLNSGMVAGGATALAMLCGIPAAYAMARMRFKGKKLFLGFVIMSQMFSPVVLLIGISQLMNTLHLNDTIPGLIFINAAFNQAFAIWLLRGTFVSISPEMEQAAKIDGCSTVGSLIRVLIPMAMPGIVTTLIFVFINAWNEYTISTVLISTASKRPITVGITQFSSFNMIEWQYLFAASLLATIPVVILFMFIEKHLTAGLTSGGVKG